MVVRTESLAVGDSGSLGALHTVYTVPAGKTAILKDIRLSGAGGAISRAVVRLVHGSAACNVIDEPLGAFDAIGRQGFMALEPGDEIQVLATGNPFLFWLSGAELGGVSP